MTSSCSDRGHYTGYAWWIVTTFTRPRSGKDVYSVNVCWLFCKLMLMWVYFWF